MQHLPFKLRPSPLDTYIFVPPREVEMFQMSKTDQVWLGSARFRSQVRAAWWGIVLFFADLHLQLRRALSPDQAEMHSTPRCCRGAA